MQLATEPSLRRVPLGSERDAYLAALPPCRRLSGADARLLPDRHAVRARRPDGTPVGIVLAIDEPDGSVELKAVAVDEVAARPGRRHSPPARRTGRSCGRHGLGESSSAPAAPGSVSSPSTRRPDSDSRGSNETSSPPTAAIPTSSSRTAFRCATWSGWTRSSPTCRKSSRGRARPGAMTRCSPTPSSTSVAPTPWWRRGSSTPREATAGAVCDAPGVAIAVFPRRARAVRVQQRAPRTRVSRRPNVQTPSTRWRRPTFRAASRASPPGSTRATPDAWRTLEQRGYTVAESTRAMAHAAR